MRAVLQRVSRARLLVDGRVMGEIEQGLLVLVAVGREDTAATARSVAEKIVNLRIFNDDCGKMNRSLLEASGTVLAVSQFTLYGDVRRGNRPSFTQAAPGEAAEPLYDRFCARAGAQRGVFGAHMEVELVNDGPVTLLVES